MPFAETRTDANGLFRLPDVGATNTARLWAAADGSEARDLGAPLVSSARLEIVLTPQVDGPRTIHGRVLDAAGAPAGGAEVSLGRTTVASDADERFALD